jgi:serine/threonine protein kinase
MSLRLASLQLQPAQPVRLGRYEVLSRLASGAMGTVYLGRAHGVGGFERLFAIKVLHPHLEQKPQIVSMLLTEARLAAQILHPNVVSVLDVDVSERGEHYVVMDYVDGFTLCELLDHPRLDALRRLRLGLRILLDATLGLDAAHRLCSPSDGHTLGIVHRDVSPSNILCSLQGTGLITDFGIARVAAQDTDSMPGVIKGTPCYMAPEQVAGSEHLDARADVWSLGVVLWEVLTGEQLFYSPHGVGGVLSLVLNGYIPLPSERNSRVPPALDALCMKALQRDPDARLASTHELADALERIAREHDLLASMHETADALAELFAAPIEQRRSSFPPSPSAEQSEIRLPPPPPVPRFGRAPLPGSSTATELDAELARLPLRRPPWLSIAITASAIAAAIIALVALDHSTAAPSLQAEPSSPIRRHDLRPDVPQPPEREATPPAETSTPVPTRHIGFAPMRVPERARERSGGDQVEVEPNPYLKR